MLRSWSGLAWRRTGRHILLFYTDEMMQAATAPVKGVLKRAMVCGGLCVVVHFAESGFHVDPLERLSSVVPRGDRRTWNKKIARRVPHKVKNAVSAHPVRASTLLW